MVGLKEKSGGEIETLQLDVLDQASIERCVAEVTALIDQGESLGLNWKGLTCLVNNAGGGEFFPFMVLFDVVVFDHACMDGDACPLFPRYCSYSD